MVVPVPAQISKLRPRLTVLPAAVRRRRLLTVHYSLPTLFSPGFKHSTPLLPITSLQLQQFHEITHSFVQRRSAIPPIFNGFRTLSIATGVYPPPTFLSGPRRFSASVPRWQIPCSQKLAASLSSLCALFGTRSLCFQPLAASFAKTPGWGYPGMQARDTRGGGTPWLLLTSEVRL